MNSAPTQWKVAHTLSSALSSATGKLAARPPRLGSWNQARRLSHWARRQGDGVRLFTRNGYNFTTRSPKIVSAAAALPGRSCFVDGEAIAVNFGRGSRYWICFATGITTMPLCSARST